MKVIHTSDWHIGRSLYGRKRYDEFEQFLNWIERTIRDVQADVLLIAGDVFDTTAPSNRAQELYYQFLCKIATSACRHVVVTAGNHDSPSFIAAPRTLLHCLNVHVIGAAPDDPADCVLELKNDSGETELIVCAVPYLRDRDVRRVEAGETIQDKRDRLMQGIKDYYHTAVNHAAGLKESLAGKPPIVAMGHLFTAGGKTVEGDGVRELYVGSLAHVDSSTFPDNIDYLALGHLHVPQTVADAEFRRYSGSPIPMGFGEAGQSKSICLVTFNNAPTVKTIPVDTFMELRSICGDWAAIENELEACKQVGTPVWAEVEYTGDDIIPDLRGRMTDITDGAPIEILRIRNNRVLDRVMRQTAPEESLEDLDHNRVFERRLDLEGVDAGERRELQALYALAVQSLEEQDANAE